MQTPSALIVCLGLAAAANPRALYEQGLALARTGDVSTARTLFGAAAEAAPDWALPRLELATILMGLPDGLEAATEQLQHATQIDPQNPRAFYQLARAYSQATRFDEAQSALRQSLRLRPGWVEAWMTLGGVYESAQKVPEAVSAYEQVLKLAQRDIGAVARLADLYERQKAWDKAEACWLRIVRSHPQTAYYAYQLAQFYSRSGAPGKARQAQARAEALAPRPHKKMRPLR